MSAGVSDQQRMKGQGNQVTNGPKEHVNEHEDFDSWRTQHHQGYTNPSMPSDPYSMSNYYGTSFPFQAFGVGDGTWSSNGDQMTFLGGYGAQMGPAEASYGMEGMFGAGGAGFGGAFGQPAQPTPAGFNYFHGNGGDYSTWGSSAGMQRKPQPHYEDYYRGGDASVQYSAVETLKDGMQGLGLSEGKGEVKGDQKEMGGGGGGSGQPKKMTWATIASQPAKPQPQMGLGGGMKKKGPGMPPPPMVPGKHNMDIGTWEGKNGGGGIGCGPSGIKAPVGPPPPTPPVKMAWSGPTGMRGNGGYAPGPAPPHHHPQVILAPPPQHYAPATLPVMPPPPQPAGPLPSHPVLDELRVKNNYNPVEFDMSAKDARFFVIKSYSEDDIHRSIKYEIWCSTEQGNKRLDQAYREREAKGGCVYLFFSVNGSGHFCGMARMVSTVDYHVSASVWSQDKWKGQFRVRWVYVKDVPNSQLRHVRLENNDNKPVTNSRDTQEVPLEKGRQVLRIMHVFRHSTSIFDDFVHYEKRQEEEDSRKDVPGPPSPPPPSQPQHSPGQHYKEREGGGGSRGGRGGGGRGSVRAN